jgi:Concanavalin A-like lectin/glucanases superfamily
VRSSSGKSLILCAAVVLGMAGCSSASGDAGDLPQPITTATQTSEPKPFVQAMHLSFQGATSMLADGAPVSDTSGKGFPGVVVLAGETPEPLSTVGGTAGSPAVRFPPPCSVEEGTRCPKAIIEVPDSPLLNPENRDFRFGARVLLDHGETSKGSNIVQKGFSNGGRGQWKLQVDGDKGRPSCVLVGQTDTEVVKAVADLSVADAAWHEIICQRRSGVLTIEVDGTEHARQAVPPGLTIAPPGPVRVGGKNVKPDNDQFFGVLEEVFFDVVEG